jgi:hypothetical protein
MITIWSLTQVQVSKSGETDVKVELYQNKALLKERLEELAEYSGNNPIWLEAIGFWDKSFSLDPEPLTLRDEGTTVHVQVH